MPNRGAGGVSYRYGFNGKETENDVKGIGNEQDYGMRIYDPRLGRFLSVDPLAKKYPGIGSYTFVANSPLNAIDPDGRLVIFVNGFYHNGGRGDSPLPDRLIGTRGGQSYWDSRFVNAALTFFNDQRAPLFVDGRGSWTSNSEDRFSDGYAWAKANFSTLTNGILDPKGVQKEPVNVVSHSMGSAYSEGIIKYLEENNIVVSTAIHLSAADPSGIKLSGKHQTIQLNYENDLVLKYKNFAESEPIKGVNLFGKWQRKTI